MVYEEREELAIIRLKEALYLFERIGDNNQTIDAASLTVVIAAIRGLLLMLEDNDE